MLRRANGRVPRMTRRYLPPLSRPQLISGVTKDSAGNPLAGCTVRLFRATDHLLREEITSGADGTFTFSAINDGAAYSLDAISSTGLLVGTTLMTLVGV
jgi:hypothetical protein